MLTYVLWKGPTVYVSLSRQGTLTVLGWDHEEGFSWWAAPESIKCMFNPMIGGHFGYMQLVCVHMVISFVQYWIKLHIIWNHLSRHLWASPSSFPESPISQQPCNNWTVSIRSRLGEGWVALCVVCHLYWELNQNISKRHSHTFAHWTSTRSLWLGQAYLPFVAPLSESDVTSCHIVNMGHGYMKQNMVGNMSNAFWKLSSS